MPACLPQTDALQPPPLLLLLLVLMDACNSVGQSVTQSVSVCLSSLGACVTDANVSRFTVAAAW